MDIAALLKQTNLFFSLAAKEDLKTILSTLDDLTTFDARLKHAKTHLKRLSSGSARVVYKTDKGSVIKIARNNKGIAQNKAESNPKMKSKFLNKIISKSKDYNWIEVEYLDKITEKQFTELTDLNFTDFGLAMRYALRFVSGNTKKDKPKNYDKVSKSDIFKELSRIGKEFSLMGGDLAKISSFGIKGKQIILIDAGLTKDIFDEFYDGNSKSS